MGKGNLVIHENLRKFQGSTDMRKGFLNRGGVRIIIGIAQYKQTVCFYIWT